MKFPMPYLSGGPGDRLNQRLRIALIDRRLREQKYPNCTSLSQTCGVSKKTIQRDIAFMRDEFQAPIEYVPGKRGYVYTDDTFAVPATILTQRDLFALMVTDNAVSQYEGTPLYEHLRDAFRKILEAIPPQLVEKHKLAAQAIHFGGLPAPVLDPDIWAALTEAIQCRRRIEMVYRRPGEEEPVDRHVEPLLLIVRNRDWFLVARNVETGFTATYYIPRIQEVNLTDRPFRPPGDFSADSFLRHGFNAMERDSDPVRVRLHFTPEVAHLVDERAWAEDQEVERREDGSAIVSFETSALFAVARQVLPYGGRVVVLDPPELKERVLKEARRAVNAHQTPGPSA